MPATISMPAGALPGTATIAHSPGAGPSTISINADGIMEIDNSIAPGIALSSVAVPNTLSAAAAFTGTTATIVSTGSGAVFTIVAPGRMIDTLPIGAQLVFSGTNTGALIGSYVSPTTYVVATTPSASTYTLVTLSGSPVFTSGTAGTTGCVINLASSTGVTLPAASMAALGVVTSTALGTALVAGTPVTLSGTPGGGTINGITGALPTGTTFYVAATPAPTTTSYSLIDSNGAPLVVAFSGGATSLTSITYTASILNSPLTSVGLNASTGISTTTGLIYTVGTAIQVTGTLTAVSGQGTISPYVSGQIYLIGASSSGTATLTTLKSSVPVVLTTGTSVGLTFTVLPSAVALSGQTGTILTANAFPTVTPTNASWTYLWQELNVTTGEYETVVGNTHFTGATTITLTMAASIVIADTGLYRCQITPTGTGVASGATATNSLPIFLRIATTA